MTPKRAARGASLAGIAVALLVTALAVRAAAPAQAGRPEPPIPLGENLVKNPGAEAGAGSDDGSKVPIPHWEVKGNFTAVLYGLADFPDVTESDDIDGGDNFFAGGPDRERSRAIQEIDVSSRATLIDREKLKVDVSAFQAGFQDQTDSGQVVVQFLNARGRRLGALRLEKVAGTNEIFEQVAGAKNVPKNTRKLRVLLISVRLEGTYADAYFDNIAVKLVRRGAAGGAN